MIYGINFNGTQIPAAAIKAARLADRLKLRKDGTLRAVGWDRSCDYRLQGVCTTEAEHDRMLSQANNGHRRFHTIRRNGWIAVYCG